MKFSVTITIQPQTWSEYTHLFFEKIPDQSQKLIEQNNRFFASITQVLPLNLNFLSPTVSPETQPGAVWQATFPPSQNYMVKRPSLTPSPEFKCTQTLASTLPQILYPLPRNKTEEMGGWWLICSAQMGQPSMKPWKVSPRIGLKGLSISKYSTLFVKAKATQFLNLSTALPVFFSMRSGAMDIDSHNLWILESLLNIQTGREMFKMPLPENRFFLMVCMMNFMTLFWAAAFTSLHSFIPPDFYQTKSFFSMRFLKGFTFLLWESLMGPRAWRTFRYFLGRMTKPQEVSSIFSSVYVGVISFSFLYFCRSYSSVISKSGCGFWSSAIEQKSSSSLLPMEREERGYQKRLEAIDTLDYVRSFIRWDWKSDRQIYQLRSIGFLNSPLKRVMQLSSPVNSRMNLMANQFRTSFCKLSIPP